MNPLRAAARLLALTGLVMWSILTGSLCHTPLQRARWMQRLSRRILRLMGATVRVNGSLPASGLIVSNHLGYLDVLVIGSALPAIFVAKNDVRSWPAIGLLCRLAGTIFVARGRRSTTHESLQQIHDALGTGLPVVLFAEGTSTDGSTVLPFKTSLLEAASNHPSTAAALSFELPGGSAEDELCYWRDMTFAPHFWNVLGKRGFNVALRFGSRQPPCADRKAAAAELREEIVSLLGA